MGLNHLMEEGSKKVKEKENYKSDKQILAENLNDHKELYSIRLLRKQTDEDLCPNNYLLMCSIYLNNLIKSYSIQQGNRNKIFTPKKKKNFHQKKKKKKKKKK